MARLDAVRTALPGLTVACLIAAVAWAVDRVLPIPVGAVALAVVLAIAVGNLAPSSDLDRGRAIAAKQVLQAGIVLLGARLSLVEIGALGGITVLLVVGTISLGGLTALALARLLGLSRALGTLIGVGSAICGNTAIMATAPLIRARSREVGLAVATITLCGTAALLLYPWIGRSLGLDDTTFGLWVGLAVQDTSQVVATGASYSDEARDVATVVKLVRNTALAAVLPLIAWWWSRGDAAAEPGRTGIRRGFPTFILGFLALSALRTVGVISERVADHLGAIASAAILVAVAGLGLGIRTAGLGREDLRAVLTGVLTAATLGLVALLAALTVPLPT